MKRPPEQEAALAKFRSKKKPERAGGVGTDTEKTRRCLGSPAKVLEASLPVAKMGRLVIAYVGVDDEGEDIDAPRIRIIEARNEHTKK